MDQCSPFTPLPQDPHAPTPSFAYDAITVRRVAVLMGMAEDAQKLARKVLTQTQACSFVEPQHGVMFARFDHAVRQSIMLAVRLEADARRLAVPAAAHDAHASSFALDAMTMRRVALLMDMAEDARGLGHGVRLQAERWVDLNDGLLLDRFDRAARQSVMLISKLEADARRLAAGKPEAPVEVVAAPANAAPQAGAAAEDAEADDGFDDDLDADEALGAPKTPGRLHRLDALQAAERPGRLDRMDELPDAPVGVLVARISLALKQRRDLSEFTDAELGYKREHWQRQASGPVARTKLPMGWIAGVDGQPVKIGTEWKDLFVVAPLAVGKRQGRDPPD